MQPEFIRPDFIEGSTAQEIHQRMMKSLPGDIDDMPGGFPYDLTMPAALEKDEIINFHLMRAIMIAFPQYAWDDWLDLHGKQVHIDRHQAQKAYGKLQVSGIAGTEIAAGTVFCTPATDAGPSIGFESLEAAEIEESGTVLIPVSAVAAGTDSNVGAHTITIMAKPDKSVTAVTNSEKITGGTERESNDDYYDRIADEYENSMTYLGNDADYVRWAKQAGAGDCIVISAADGPGTVKLVLVDENGQPANDKLLQDVYGFIVSPDDRSKRLLPTACAQLICVSAATVKISYTCTGILCGSTTDIEQIKKEFEEAVKAVYTAAKEEGVLRYNDIRPLMSGIAGVEDFDMFLVNGGMDNIELQREEYPETGIIDFS